MSIDGFRDEPVAHVSMCVEIDKEFALTANSSAVQHVLVSEFNAARVALARRIVELRKEDERGA